MSTKPDLNQYTDLEILRICAEESPEFGDILEKLIGDGRTDEEIIRMAAAAGASGQCMHYAAKCIRAIRSLQT